jgi:hypothetical protein
MIVINVKINAMLLNQITFHKKIMMNLNNNKKIPKISIIKIKILHKKSKIKS